MLDFSKASEWMIIENGFDPAALGKVETNFCLGNGYLGLRSATEERYLEETRDLLVAGTFDCFSPEEDAELPNAADVTNIEMTLNGCRFDLTQGTIRDYRRSLNIQNGLLTREVVWLSPSGRNYTLKFERIVSLKRLHTIAARVSITPESSMAAAFRSGIDGRTTCDGSQHFTEGEARFYNKKYLQFTSKTIQSGITFVVGAAHRFYVGGTEFEPRADISVLRRRAFSAFTLNAKAGQTIVLEKFSNVYTSQDRELEDYTLDQTQAYALKALQEDEKAGFDALLAESAACWTETVWDRVPIEIDGPEFDQLAVRFAQYHIRIMTPAHDNRIGIGANGLSGESRRGRASWNTEQFLLPYFVFNMPEVARSLIECPDPEEMDLYAHAVPACDFGNPEHGYEMFQKACLIDLDNRELHSSDAGIHAAAHGGLWQCVVLGFGGLRVLDGKLRIRPNLPKAWKKLDYTLIWRGQKLQVVITSKKVQITGEMPVVPVKLEVWGREYNFEGKLTVSQKSSKKTL